MKRKEILMSAIKRDRSIKSYSISTSMKENRIGSLRKIIVIGNLSKRAGASFITLNLAASLSESGNFPCIVEPPLGLPYLFDTIGIEQRLNNVYLENQDSFYSFPHAIKDGIIERKKETIIDNILWMILDSRKPIIEDWDEDNMMELLYCTRKADTVLIDVGSYLKHDSLKQILNIADHVLIVIDPLPAEIMQNNKKLEYLKNQKLKGMPVSFIINRFTKGITRNELLNFLDIEPISFIPAVNASMIHEAIYKCEVPYFNTKVKDVLQGPFISLISRLAGENLEKEKSNFFKKVIKGGK